MGTEILQFIPRKVRQLVDWMDFVLKTTYDTDQAAQNTAIAGKLTQSTADTLYKNINYQPTAANISDATTAGRTILTAANANAQRTALGLGGAAVLNVGTTTGTVAAGDDSRIVNALSQTTANTLYKSINYQPASTDISDSTAAGRTLLTSASNTAQRTALGLGDSATRNVGTINGTVAAGDDSRIVNALDQTAGDARYGQLSGATFTGPVAVTGTGVALAGNGSGAATAIRGVANTGTGGDFRTNSGLAFQTFALALPSTNTVQNMSMMSGRANGTAATGFGIRDVKQLESSTTNDRDAAYIDTLWTDATDATRTAEARISLAKSGTMTEAIRADHGDSSTQTNLFVRYNNTFVRVLVGASDSGGSGFRMLRIPN